MVLIKKVITCRLNISDVSNQFCPDYKAMRLNELTKQYVGYCSHGILITNILSIIKSSQIRTNPKVCNGNMYVDINALVEGIIYESGEIISDATITEITDTIAIASSKYANINIDIGKINILKIGDITPVIVNISQYNKFTKKISVAATSFMPLKPKINIYIVHNYLKTNTIIELKNEVNEVIEKINSLKEYMQNLTGDQKDAFKFFNELIYPYKSSKELKTLKLSALNTANTATLSLQKFDFIKDNKLPNMIVETYGHYSETNTYITEYKDKDELLMDIWKQDDIITSIINIDMTDLYCKLLTSYHIHLNELKELIEYYNKERIKNAAHIWKFYEMNKL